VPSRRTCCPPVASRSIAYILDLTKPAGMFIAVSFMLRDGNTLYVTNAPFTKWLKIMQAIAPLVTFSSSVKTLSGG